MNSRDLDLLHPQLNSDFLATAIYDPSAETEWNDGQGRSEARQVLAIPLGHWQGELRGRSSHRDPLDCAKDEKISLVRKVIVAFAVANVTQHLLDSRYSIEDIQRILCVDNFVVRVRADDLSDLGWEVEGVDVISPELAVQIRSSWISNCSLFDLTADDITGRNVEATITRNTENSRPHHARRDSNEGGCDGRMVCYLLGRFFHSVFCGDDSQFRAVETHGRQKDYGICDPAISEPSYKKNYVLSTWENSVRTRYESLPKDVDEIPQTKKTSINCGQLKNDFLQSDSIQGLSFASTSRSEKSTRQIIDQSIHANSTPLCNDFCPSAISQLVTNLLDCGTDLYRSVDSYQSLEEVKNDLHILLQEPGIFLFDQYRMSNVEQRLAVNKDKLYGRAAETTLLTDAFCRVASTGVSEAVFVAGFSGCGKTRLVQSVFESVDAAGGYVVVQKFDETSTRSPLLVLLSTLNDLCGLIVEKNSPEELRELFNNIRDSTNLTLLSRVMPNISRMNSSDAALRLHAFNEEVSSGLNFHMLVFAVMRLMRIISSRSRPVMIFLDDLQWADTASLDLVHAILSDIRGSNCVFFIGSYRDQDVKQGHFVFEFIQTLSAYEVPCTELLLDGLTEDALNLMLSDALCLIPRLCKSLSSIVHHKTRGSPFFTIEFLNSLIDRGVLVNSLRARRWVWDIDQIHAEDITDNVLQIISDKMTLLDDDDQNALKLAACFGIKIDESCVLELSRTPLFNDLQSTLDKAVENGFMERERSNFRFVHDKIREAAYLLIDSKDEYHFNVGMSLYSILADANEEHSTPTSTMLAQINHGVPSLLICKERRICIAELNYKESLKSFEGSDFTSAHRYIKAAVSLLPEDTWTSNYDRSLKYFFQFAKAAHTCGYIREARDSLNDIITNGRLLEETYPSYFLLTKILLLACNNLSQSFDLCRKVLGMLGEDVPTVEMATNDLITQVTKAKALLNDSELLHGKQVPTEDWKDLAVMQAYYQLITITYLSHPEVMPYYAGRWAQYMVLKNVSSRYTSKCIVTLAGILCRDMSQDARIGYKLGKQALSMLDFSFLGDAAYVFLIFYGFVGELFEPIQACLDMLRRGYEMAMQAGNLSDAAFHKIFMLSQCMKTGMNLLDLKEDIETELSLSTHRSQTFMVMRLRCYRETILTLIGETSTGHCALFSDEDLTSKPNLIETQCLDELMCSAYLGSPEQYHCLSKLYVESPQAHRRSSIAQRSFYAAFYFGIFVASMYRKKSDAELLTKLDDSILIVATAVEFSEWNFKNKLALLRAEFASLEGYGDDAEDQYDISIAAARSSKFIHEEGLACELAGFHCKNHGKEAKALNLFREAERCYQAWGSNIKSNQMVCMIRSSSVFGGDILGGN